ncbi:hypothetical protein HDU67_005695 [Dinochytrium kinnereticum]|nr:hypothetical protein HDU67_005695 [Dinochytrium kinnereticum]
MATTTPLETNSLAPTRPLIPFATITTSSADSASYSQSRIGLSDMNTQRFAMLGSVFIVGLDTAMFPLNTLQTIMMSERSVKGRKSIGVLKLTSHILREPLLKRVPINEIGIGRFWKGAGTAIVGSFPGQACYYMTYESVQELFGTISVKNEAPANVSNTDVTFFRGFVAGASADVAAGIFYVPTDIIAQRLQTQNAGRVSFTHNCSYLHPQTRLYKGPLDVAQQIWRHEGTRGFWRGYLGYVASFAPASAVQWGTYELLKTLTVPFGRSLYTMISPNHIPGEPMGSTALSLVDRTSVALSGGIAGVTAVVVNNPLEVMRVRHQLLESRSPADAETIRQGYIKLGLSILRREGIGAFYRGLKVRLVTTVPSVILAMSGYEAIKEMSNTTGL